MSMFTSSAANAVAEGGSGDQATMNGNGERPATLTGGVQEDALLAVSALLEALGESFLEHLPKLTPILSHCLSNYSETQVCINAVGLLGDLCRVLSRHIMPYCEEYFAILMNILQVS